MSETIEELTTEHDIYISIGLKHPMKPNDCRDLIDSLIVENFTLDSWGTHTKDEWIQVVSDYQVIINQKNKEIEVLKRSTFPIMASILHDEQKKIISDLLKVLEFYSQSETTSYWNDGGAKARHAIQQATLVNIG